MTKNIYQSGARPIFLREGEPDPNPRPPLDTPEYQAWLAKPLKTLHVSLILVTFRALGLDKSVDWAWIFIRTINPEGSDEEKHAIKVLTRWIAFVDSMS